MALKTFEVPVTLTFNGFVRVKASSLRVAYNKAEHLWDRDIDVEELEGVSIEQQVLADSVSEVEKPRRRRR